MGQKDTADRASAAEPAEKLADIVDFIGAITQGATSHLQPTAKTKTAQVATQPPSQDEVSLQLAQAIKTLTKQVEKLTCQHGGNGTPSQLPAADGPNGYRSDNRGNGFGNRGSYTYRGPARPRYGGTCGYCGIPGHHEDQCNRRERDQHAAYAATCSTCKQNGHYALNCPRNTHSRPSQAIHLAPPGPHGNQGNA